MQLTHVQDKVVESLAPHVPEYLSNTTELQRKLGFEIPSIFSESERTRQRPGQMLYEEGYRPKHPVIVIPGFVTSGLELWQGKPCATRFFRWQHNHLATSAASTLKLGLSISSE